MNLSTTQKVVLGIFTILPLVLLPFIFFQFFRIFFHDLQNSIDHESPVHFFEVFLQFMVPSLILSMLSIVLLIFYLVHVGKNNGLNTNERLVWILVFIFAGLAGFPAYWYLRIWNTPAPTTNHLTK